MKLNLAPILGLCVAACLLASCSPNKSKKGEAINRPPIAVDHSLTVEAYVQLGMPSPDKVWTPQDFLQAGGVLRNISQKNPEELPRFGSKSSGRLFDRICARENLAGILDKNSPLNVRISLVAKYLEGAGLMLKAYVEPAIRDTVLDVEMVEIMGLTLKGELTAIDLGNRFQASIPKDDPKLAARKAGLSQMAEGVATSFEGGIISLSETKTYRNAARLKLCGYLQETLPSAIPELPDSAKNRLLRRIKEAQKSESNDEIKGAIARLGDAVSAASSGAPR